LNAKANTDLSNLSAAGNAILNAKANTDLSNLSAAGNARFGEGLANKITDCILSCQNPMYTISTNTVTFKSGIRCLYSNGRNTTDSTLINLDLTNPSQIIYNVSAAVGNTVGLYLKTTNTGSAFSIIEVDPAKVSRADSQPAAESYTLWYDTINNKWMQSNGSTWTQVWIVLLMTVTKS
jgi:hypothetical protein